MARIDRGHARGEQRDKRRLWPLQLAAPPDAPTPVELHFSQQELSDIAGARESVNKIERNWYKARWSERTKGTIVIRDLAEIRRLADMPDL